MFTGIIEEVGNVTQHTPGLLAIRAPGIAGQARLGDSIATNGICLTLTRRSGETFYVDYSDTTRGVTTVGHWRIGDPVNLEQALTLNTRLGGHLVSGHVDGIGHVKQVREHGANGVGVTISVPAELHRYLLKKGSIAIDGISLTIVDFQNGCVDLTVVPHTWTHTTLRERRPGDAVNVEVDILGKYVERLMGLAREAPSKLNWAELAQQGYG